MTSSMSCAQFAALIDAGGYGKLQDYLDDEFGETSSLRVDLPEADVGVYQRAHQLGRG